jgi:NADH:ubiquinone oxidoreductase subunit 6 (subunit J)
MEILANLSNIGFYLLATASVICALGMIFNPNLVRAGFTLIGSFVAIAGLYFMLSANFVAVSQVLIYAVGIVLVIVFAVMLCSLKESPDSVTNDDATELDYIKRRRIVGLVLSLGVFYLLTYVIQSQNWNAIMHVAGADSHRLLIPEVSEHYTAQIGNLMLTKYVLPFELISVLLLIVLIGVIILSKKNIDTTEENK